MQDQPIARALQALAGGRGLGEQLTAEAFGQLMRGEATAAQAAALLMGLRMRGETPDEVTGAARALREAMVRVPLTSADQVIDTCGTGGGTVSTFNVSTAAALVVAGAGGKVAKHGNRSYTSKCGSADVIEALGVAMSPDAETAARVLASAGMVFLFAPAYHPAMRFVAPVRRELGVATIMNVIGPLANPAGVRRQVVGVADRSRGPILAEALRRLGAEHALVVHALVGMDEISPSGTTDVWEVRDGEVRTWSIDPTRYGIDTGDLAALAGGEASANAARMTRLLDDPEADSVGRATVLLNAAAGLYVAGLARDLNEGLERGSAALRSGAAAQALERLRRAASTS
jgi:anthranilate phosphoribosyltransferase